MRRESSHIVKEILLDTIYGCSYQSHASPFSRGIACRQREHLLSFQCAAKDEHEFVAHAPPHPVGRGPAPQPERSSIYVCSLNKEERSGHLLAVGGEDGHLAVVDTNVAASATPITPAAGVSSVHQNAVMAVAWVAGSGGSMLVSGGGDAAAVVWRQRAGRLHPLLKLLGHTGSIKAVDVNPHDPSVFATGSRDNNIIVWDRRCSPNQRADEITPAHPSLASFAAGVAGAAASPRYRRGGGGSGGGGQAPVVGATHNNGVTSLLFTQQHTLVSAGASDGLIKVWDLRKSHCVMRSAPLPQHTLFQPRVSSKLGFSCLTQPLNSHYLYALAMDNNIYAYNLALPHTCPVACYTGGLNLSYYVKAVVSECGRYIVAGGTDQRALVWLTSRPGPPVVQLSGHFGEVTAVDCTQAAGEKIVTCADDYKHRIFRLKRTDPDDFDENLLIRGRAEEVDVEVLQRCRNFEAGEGGCNGDESMQSTTSASAQSSALSAVPRTPRSSQPCNTGSLMKTPSRSGTSNNIQNTPRRGANSSNSNNNQNTPLRPTPNTMSTPLRARNDQSFNDHNTPQTPSSVDRSGTLSHWLSSVKKTPRPAQATPSHSGTSGSVSASKRAGLKRKLTDLMEDPRETGEENNVDGSSSIKKKAVISPLKNVLVNISNDDCVNNPMAAVKMLKYERTKDKTSTVSEIDVHPGDTLLSIGDSIKPFDINLLDSLMTPSFMKSVNKVEERIIEDKQLTCDKIIEENKSEIKQIEKRIKLSTPNKTVNSPKRQFDSPTANLPNFVVDGVSPRVRPVPVFEKKPAAQTWLTSLSQQRRLKFSNTPDKTIVSESAKKSKRVPRTGKHNNREKKYLKIISLSDRALKDKEDKVKSTKKMIQAKLKFEL